MLTETKVDCTFILRNKLWKRFIHKSQTKPSFKVAMRHWSLMHCNEGEGVDESKAFNFSFGWKCEKLSAFVTKQKSSNESKPWEMFKRNETLKGWEFLSKYESPPHALFYLLSHLNLNGKVHENSSNWPTLILCLGGHSTWNYSPLFNLWQTSV